MFGGLVGLLVAGKRGAQLSILKMRVFSIVVRICGLMNMMDLMLLCLMSLGMILSLIKRCLL